MLADTPTIDLVSLIEQKSGIRLVKRATTGHGEYWGACPFCQTGTNRFHCWPNKIRDGQARPYYWCRACEKRGDSVAFLKEYCNLSFVEACQELGIDPALPGWAAAPAVQEHDGPPSEQWQACAKWIVARAERYLWLPNAPKAVEALAYLRGRGLTDETIKNARLGYVPLQPDGRWFLKSFEHWGIDESTLTDEQRAKGGVRVPDGILIPWFEGPRLWKLAIKRPGQKMDYGQVMGSSEGLYGIDSIEYGKPVMMVEGEIDALSVLQEAGDLVGCVATGSATRGRSPRWIGDLALASVVLQSFDEDKAGDDGAEYWLETLPHAIRWSPILWKDPNALLMSQPNPTCTLREWVWYGIDAATYQPEAILEKDTEPLEVLAF